MKKKGFTIPCFMVVKDKDHSLYLRRELNNIGGRKVYEIQENTPYPCVCGVSTNIVSICEMKELATVGFIDCGDNEELFLALAAIRDDTDYLQWFVFNKEPLFVQCKTPSRKNWFAGPNLWHKANVEELKSHFNKTHQHE